MLLIETGFVVVMVLWAFIFPELGSPFFRPVERGLAKLSRRRGLAVFVVGASALALRVTLLPILPIPQPAVQDEFSYLLMSDTFAHGRLTNATHPMWVHFESFHIIQKPTYASMYFPAQGLFLAVGQVIFHHPFWGVWLSAGLMCAAICWMLQAWLPPFWALIGGFLAVIRLATFSYWANTYFGGNVAALGGALVLGALPRIERSQRARDAVIMGMGLALLVGSRPYESIFFSLPIACSFLLWILRLRGPSLSKTRRQVVFPIAMILLATISALLYYFWRVTGSPFRTPYSVNLAAYNPLPSFLWQSIKSWPVYHHEIMRRFYSGWLFDYYEFVKSHPVASIALKIVIFGAFYLGPLLIVPIFMLSLVLPRGFSFKDIKPRTRFLLLVFCCASLGILLSLFVLPNPHYAAPVTASIYALLLTALQRIRHWRWNRKPVGLAIVRGMSTTAVLLIMICGSRTFFKISAISILPTWCSSEPAWSRPRIQAQLESLPGRHLVLVRYSHDHDPGGSWVANAADIDGSKVVWANDMGPLQNQELIDYFKDRKVWVVEPDVIPARLSEYTADSRTTTGKDPS